MRTATLRLSAFTAALSALLAVAGTVLAGTSQLVISAPAAITANTPFAVTVRLTDGFGNTIPSNTDRIYLSVNRLGAGSLVTTNGVVTFTVRAASTPVTVTATDPARSLTATVVVPAGAAPSFTSAAQASFPVGRPSTFAVSASGTPTPRFTLSWAPGTAG